jgi:hypothetical protein
MPKTAGQYTKKEKEQGFTQPKTLGELNTAVRKGPEAALKAIGFPVKKDRKKK